MEEIWKDIQGYEGYYQVSSFGRIKSVERVVNRKNGRLLPKKSKIMSNTKSGNGYLIASLSKDNNRKSAKIHRLVAQAFIPNPYNKPQVNHIDGNKLNNHVENLEWCTSSENQLHAIRTGLKTFKYGENHPQCKITDREVAIIKLLSKKYCVPSRTLAAIFSISKTQILDILRENSRKTKEGDFY